MNCNDTLTYAKELRRLCESRNACAGCSMESLPCTMAIQITPAHIKVVQKWSEDNPVSLNNEAKNQFIKDFKAYWGSDVAEEDLPLYLELIKWIREEFEKI